MSREPRIESDGTAPRSAGRWWSRLAHEDAMAFRRTRTFRQRLSIWVTAALTLGTGLAAYRVTEHHPPSSEPLTFRIEELLPAQTGIRFVHVKPELPDPIFDNVRPLAQAVGSSVAVADVDRDGLLDVYLTNGGAGTKNALYFNLGGFRFAEADIPAISDINREGYSTDALFADVDNDGYDDLLVMYIAHRPRLFLNVPAPDMPRGRTFVEATEKSGLPGFMNAYTATFLDVDNDGDLDLVMAGYLRTRYSPDDVAGGPLLDFAHIPDSPGAGRFMPNSQSNATNGGEKHLLLNDGSGHFVEQDVARWGFRPEHRMTWDIGAGDLNGDGFTDLYFSNDFGSDELYFNQGGHSFRPFIGRFPNDIGRDVSKGMNAEIADINGDGYPEIYVTNIFHPILPEGNMLWLNLPAKGKGATEREFQNVSAELGVKDGSWAWGAKFADIDLDGDTDIVATDGNVSNNPKKDYWYAMSRLGAASSTIMADARNWPPFRDASFSGYQITHVFLREGSRFYDRAEDAGLRRSFDGRGVALADFDLDGRVALLITAQGAAPFIARNVFVPTDATPEPPGFIGLQLVGDGRRVNRNAVGARVVFRPAGGGDGGFPPLYREVNAGNGFSAQSMYWIVAGLGRYRGDVEVEIRWTDGTSATHRLTLGGYYRVAYGATPERVGRADRVVTDAGQGGTR
jgi:enediyne biosynthesis protein E4